MLRVTLRPEAIEKFHEEKTYNKYMAIYESQNSAWNSFLEVNKCKVVRIYTNNKYYPTSQEKNKIKQHYLDTKYILMYDFRVAHKLNSQNISKSLFKEILYVVYLIKKNQQLNKNRMQSLG